MNGFASAFGLVSTALAVYCCMPYVQSILNGRTKPHQLSWAVFTIMNGIVTLSQFSVGGRASVLISLTFFIGSMLNFVLSLRFGTRNSSRFDRTLFLISLITIAIWLITKNNALAIWLTVLIDVMATTMIILKILAERGSEAVAPWVIGTLAYGFACLALCNRSPGLLYVRPIYGLLSDFAVLAAIWQATRLGQPQRSITKD
jgi:hypothetical protein